MDSGLVHADVVQRCQTCSVALTLLAYEATVEGATVVRRRTVPHTDLDCRRFAALRDEEWPSTLLSALARRRAAADVSSD